MGTEYMSRCLTRGRPSLEGSSLITFCSFPDPGCRKTMGALRLFGVVGDCCTVMFDAFGLASSSCLACVFIVFVGGSILGASGAADRDPGDFMLCGLRAIRGCSMSVSSLPESSRGATLALAFPLRCMLT
jgi:hypothetical protein